MKKIVRLIAAVCWILGGTFGYASTYTFTDTGEGAWTNWPGYNTADSTKDVIGTPDILSMTVKLDENGILETVELVLTKDSNWLSFNSLFINSYAVDTTNNSWDDWDYYLYDYTHGTQSEQGHLAQSGLYRVESGYQYTTVDSDESRRNGNPNGIQAGDLTLASGGTSSTEKWVSNWVMYWPWEWRDEGHWELDWQENHWSGSSNASDDQLWTYNFAHMVDADGKSISIDLGDGFFMAFSPYCSNDLIGGGTSVDDPANPVPEPATMALLGLGLLGLAGEARRRRG